MPMPGVFLEVSGERFQVVYHLTGDEAEARSKAEDICIEQTIEFPSDLIAQDDIRRHILGRIEAFQSLDANHHEVVLSYAVELVGSELTQLLSVIFGNISIKPGIRVERFQLSDRLLKAFRGPRFGRAGLRNLLGVTKRPLLCTAIKPLGLNSKQLAELAYECAAGGIDIIKDDHGLADQQFAPFHERVERCAAAVARANQETGRKSIYVPSITGPASQVIERARFARQTGAGGLLVAPGLLGPDVMRQLADDEEIALPIISHPAFQGSFVTDPHSGISHYALFGQVARLAGADATIFPNYGGRFSFSREECRSIAEGTAAPMGHIKEIFPAPGGGMSLARIPEMLDLYGQEVVLLIGGDLHRHGPDLADSSRRFLQLVEQA